MTLPGLMRRPLQVLRIWLDWLNGDAAYRAYCARWRREHTDCDHPPPSRAAFYRAELDRRWSGVRRCC